MPGAVDWADAAFLDGAHAWISARLAELGSRETGPIEQIHARPWSTVLRVPTDRGPVFFKASAPAFRHEVALVELLSRRRPDVVPAPLAADRGLGWMLMADAGTRLREIVARERDLSRWLDVLPLYASLQADLAGSADELLALGAPDMRLGVLPARYAALLDDLDGLVAGGADGGPSRRGSAASGAAHAPSGGSAATAPSELRRLRDAVPRVAVMCAELAALGIAETIEHDDLNDAAVYVRDGRCSILDWGDACVSHPFFSLSVALEGVIAWGVDDVEGSADTAPFRDAYLAAFAGAGKPGDRRRASATAIRLGWACRAVNGHIPGEDPGPTWTRLRMFLDGHPGPQPG